MNSCRSALRVELIPCSGAAAFRLSALLALTASAGCVGSIDGEDGSGVPGARDPAKPAVAAMNNPAGAGATAEPGAPNTPGMTPVNQPGPSPMAVETPPAPPPPFVCAGGSSTAAPPRRLWRLTRGQYLNTLSVFVSGKRADGMFPASLPGLANLPFEPVELGDRFSNTARSQMLTDFDYGRAYAIAEQVAQSTVALLRKQSTSCLGGARTPFADCVRSLVSTRGPLLFGRPLLPAELDGYTGLATQNAAGMGEDLAVVLALRGLMLAPGFVYRSEVGAGAPDAAGAVRLDNFELASALSYTLLDQPPDELLWQAATAGQLRTPQEIRAQVLRLFENPSANGVLVRFVREYFRYGRAVNQVKTIADYNPARMVSDTDALASDLVKNNGTKDFLKTLLSTSNVVFDGNTARWYGIGGINSNDGKTRRLLPENERAGIMTQPSFLAALSNVDHNETVKRGLFISTSLLCRDVPELAIDQIPPLPKTANATMREKLAVHSARPDCNACHRLMDPMGLPFEGYDMVGKRRSTEFSKPLDTTGMLTDSGNQDGPFADAVALSRKLANSTKVEECFTRHLFRYLVGREEIDGDACTILQVRDAYAKSGGDLRELMAALFTSRAFLARNTKL